MAAGRAADPAHTIVVVFQQQSKSHHHDFLEFGPCAGARFHRVDLHVHSHGVSPDVTDEQMTPQRIVDVAKERDIGLLAITDHNAIDAVPALVAAADDADIAVLAGVELTTSDGHLLAYFDPLDLDTFERWFARLDFQENVKPSGGY
jgi:DNA polymerase III alpha subunit (gram-positive type)